MPGILDMFMFDCLFEFSHLGYTSFKVITHGKLFKFAAVIDSSEKYENFEMALRRIRLS